MAYIAVVSFDARLEDVLQVKVGACLEIVNRLGAGIGVG
jgi:hypothetical protein